MSKRTRYNNDGLFYEKVKEIISGITYYQEYSDIVHIEYSNNGITFTQLEALSKLLKTTLIDFEGRTEEFRYSEWTADTEKEGEIVCKGVVFSGR